MNLVCGNERFDTFASLASWLTTITLNNHNNSQGKIPLPGSGLLSWSGGILEQQVDPVGFTVPNHFRAYSFAEGGGGGANDAR